MFSLFSGYRPLPSLISWGAAFFLFSLLFFFSSALAQEKEYEADIRQAAHDGDPQSQFALALLYEYGGETIGRDQEQSAHWLKLAAGQGIGGACLYLGLKYEHGTGVDHDYRKAVCWYTCAAKKDWPSAQFFLARLYEHGKGVPQSTLNALAMLSLASESGYPGAEEEFSRLQGKGESFDPQQIETRQKKLMTEASTPCN